MPPHDTEQARWFAEEVQTHEPALRAYLRVRFPAVTEHDDIVQDSYLRIVRAKIRGKISFSKALLFATARNLAFDWFRRRRVKQTETLTDFCTPCVLDEKPDAAELASQQQELEIFAEAMRALPDRCHEVISLRYIDDLSYKEIAAKLGISPETVKVHLAKGMRRCGEFLAKRGVLR